MARSHQTAQGLVFAQPGVCDQTWAAGSVHRCNSWGGGFNLEKSMMSWVEYPSPASCCHLHQLSVVRHTSSLILQMCADTQLWRSNQVKSWHVRKQHILNNRCPPPLPPPPPHWEGSASHRQRLFTSTHLSSVRGRPSVSHDAHAHGKRIRLDGCL